MHCHFYITDEILTVQKKPDDLVTKKGPPGAGLRLSLEQSRIWSVALGRLLPWLPVLFCPPFL